MIQHETEVISMRKKSSYFETLGQMLSDAYRVNTALFHIRSDFPFDRTSR